MDENEVDHIQPTPNAIISNLLNQPELTPTPSLHQSNNNNNRVEVINSYDSHSEISLGSDVSLASSLASSELRGLLSKAYHVISEKEKELDQAYKLRQQMLEENSNLKGFLDQLNVSLPISNSNASSLPNSLKSPLESPKEYDESQFDTSTPTKIRFNRRSMLIKPESDNLKELESINLKLQSKLDQLNLDKEEQIKNGKKELGRVEKEVEFLKSEMETCLLKIKELEESNMNLTKKARSSMLLVNKIPERRFSYVPQSPKTSMDVKPTFFPKFERKISGMVYNEDNQLFSEPLQEEDGQEADELLTEQQQKDMTSHLLDTVDQLQKVNHTLALGKREAEERLRTLESDLKQLKLHALELENSLKLAERTHDIIDQQANHIAELNGRLENQRGGLIHQLFFSPKSAISTVTTTNTTIEGYSSIKPKGGTSARMVYNDPRFNNYQENRRNNHIKSYSISSIATSSSNLNGNLSSNRPTMLNALESQFYKNGYPETSLTATNSLVDAKELQDRYISELTDSPANFRNLDLNLHNISPPPLIDEYDPLLPERADSIQSIENRVWYTSETQPSIPRPRNPTPHGLISILKKCIGSIFKWCRFVTLLLAAVGMAVYRGPDSDAPGFYD